MNVFDTLYAPVGDSEKQANPYGDPTRLRGDSRDFAQWLSGFCSARAEQPRVWNSPKQGGAPPPYFLESPTGNNEPTPKQTVRLETLAANLDRLILCALSADNGEARVRLEPSVPGAAAAEPAEVTVSVRETSAGVVVEVETPDAETQSKLSAIEPVLREQLVLRGMALNVLTVYQAVEPVEQTESSVEGIRVPPEATSLFEESFVDEMRVARAREAVMDMRREDATPLSAEDVRSVSSAGSVASGAVSAPAGDLPRVMDATMLAEHLDRLVLRAVRADENSIRIELDPPELGRLVLQCRETSNGLTVQLNVESPVIRALLVGQEQDLRSSLEAQGMQLERFSVTTRDGDGRESGDPARQQAEQENEGREERGRGRGRGHANETAGSSGASRPTYVGDRKRWVA